MNMDPVAANRVKEYYAILGKKAIVPDSPFSALGALFAPSNGIVVSDSRCVRALGRLRRLERIRAEDAEKKAVLFLALRDAFGLLARKGVPVYFYNRVGKKKSGFRYSDREVRRMEEGLSFPVMYQDVEKHEDDLRDVFGDLYSREYVREIGRIPQVVKVGSVYQHENCCGPLVNVVNGKRVTTDQPAAFARTIHVYGRCGAFGYAVEDKDTIPSLLQKELLENGMADVRVVNHGLWGGGDDCIDHNFLQDAVGMKEGDVVLFYRKHFDKRLLAEFEKRGVRYKEITEEWHARKDGKVAFFDKPGHMNAEGYRLVAKLIREDIEATGLGCGPCDRSALENRPDCLNHYLKSAMDDDFAREVDEYVEGIKREFPLDGSSASNGAIVMNCNPFTYGHRHLVETAAKQVDRLYIFVVEEDKSFFLFKDRFEMVKKGTEDLANVVVVPSGKFIISAFTFPEYFMKDYVKEKDFDVSTDVETFCKYIAPRLKIGKRFAGEEPFDPVTRNYNENMARILPEHGMEFVEIPRYALDSERVVNATRVRELLKNGDFEQLKEYVPQSTYDVLVAKYAG